MALLRNISFLTASQITEKVLSLLIIVFITRKLGAAEFGLYSLTMSFVALFYYFYDGGLQTFLIKEVGKNRAIERGYLNRIITLRVILCVFAAIISLITAYASGYGAQEFYGILIFSLATAFVYTSSILRAPFMGIEKMEVESGLTITFRFLSAVGILLLLVMGVKMPHLMLPYLLSGIVVMLMSVFIFKRYFHNYTADGGSIKMLTILRKSIPFALAAFMGEVLFNIDKVILAKYETLSTVGLYNGAYKIVIVGMFIPSGLTMAAFPKMANLWAAKRNAIGDFINQLTKPLLTLGLCISFIAAVNSTEVIALLFGAKFSESAQILKYLIWIVPAVFLSHLTDIVLQATERQWFACVSMTVAVTANVILNIFLIPVLHGLGSAYAALIAVYSVLIARMYIINRDTSGAFNLMLYLKLILITLTCGTLCYIIKGFLPWIAEAAVGATMFFLLTYITGCVTKEDIRFIKEIRKRKN
ncbi:flippase [Candidatus Magnetomonas plexicatena]|uniref:flippase n=1 Tax=Candidatus Magnetomonas plexicatena TaxID=2552947 RepID=UPI001C748EAD|nr:flippase [Nitrospirales bacterium LBB_01]